jgi:hypothetical protein
MPQIRPLNLGLSADDERVLQSVAEDLLPSFKRRQPFPGWSFAGLAAFDADGSAVTGRR